MCIAKHDVLSAIALTYRLERVVGSADKLDVRGYLPIELMILATCN